MEVSSQKSNWIIFAQGNAIKIPKSLSINGSIILRVHSHRFLGVILDHKLDGKLYLRYLIDKGKKYICHYFNSIKCHMGFTS